MEVWLGTKVDAVNVRVVYPRCDTYDIYGRIRSQFDVAMGLSVHHAQIT